jgi:hypothetical protein
MTIFTEHLKENFHRRVHDNFQRTVQNNFHRRVKENFHGTVHDTFHRTAQEIFHRTVHDNFHRTVQNNFHRRHVTPNEITLNIPPTHMNCSATLRSQLFAMSLLTVLKRPRKAVVKTGF